MGGQTLEQGDYSRFKGTGIPHCCKKDPIVVDLLPGTPYNQQIANCCKGGVINSWMQDPTNAASPFQLRVGSAGTTNKTLVPKNIWTGLYLWTCKSGEFDQVSLVRRRRVTQAMSKLCDMEPYVHIFTVSGPKISNLLWSMSSFYNDTINAQLVLVDVRITSLSQEVVWSKFIFDANSPDTPHLASVVSSDNEETNYSPLVQCSSHMCPIWVHQHVKLNYEDYWRVKVTITNYNYRMNYNQWNLVVRHPNI
ncbi:unnamed protein product [Fraxinus pennsylvanica]|uniref:COBRA C-terminal domain-containing protein n=1 Tax=Fraxinus pennsylvanica TaxID=56036 RepID=A0AAD1YK77_9LAMI|nr:unnamed protein product [Fraxinus pennsylvanica]